MHKLNLPALGKIDPLVKYSEPIGLLFFFGALSRK
jgi:hypothetical protein